MKISREETVVRVSEPGHAEDDTNVHEFVVIEDLCDDPFDHLAAGEGHQPKARVEFKRSGTKDRIGIDWWGTNVAPRRVTGHLESNGYIVV
jgi:hypothetical protein